jgi:hypothetical protein
MSGELEAVADYNHWRYYKSLGNVTPGRDLLGRDQTMRINDRPSQNRLCCIVSVPLNISNQTEPETPLNESARCPKNSADG